MVEICKIAVKKVLWGNQLITPSKCAVVAVLNKISRLPIQIEPTEVVVHACS